MKKTFLKIALLTFALVASVKAEVAVTSFQLTNNITPGVNITSYPTNSQNSGVTNVSTGTFLSTANYGKDCGFLFMADYTATNAGTIAITLTRTMCSGTPVGTNFESLPNLTFSAATLVGTNLHLVWTTNFPTGWIEASTHVGIYIATNTSIAGSGTMATNAQAFLLRKLIPAGNK